MTAFTSLFMASKNSEVEPLHIKDIKNGFLQRQVSQDRIIFREKAIRSATQYENEVTTHFDYVMLLIKIWKLGC